jgi:hypothetical protein
VTEVCAIVGSQDIACQTLPFFLIWFLQNNFKKLVLFLDFFCFFYEILGHVSMVCVLIFKK